MINRLKKDKPQINVIIFHILFNIEIYFLRSILTFFLIVSRLYLDTIVLIVGEY